MTWCKGRNIDWEFFKRRKKERNKFKKLKKERRKSSHKKTFPPRLRHLPDPNNLM